MDNKKKYLIAGGGISGIAAAKLLYSAGEETVLYDGNDTLSMEELREKLGEASGIPIELGSLSPETVEQTDICVMSPGIPLTAPFVKALTESGCTLWSEIELAWRYGKGRIAAITGTNGKTTTTALVGAILKEHCDQVSVVGNIGIPYTGEALKLTEDSVVAAEISSFQLESIVDFRPDVSAILNITPDHLNRHGTMEEYIRVKESIAKNQTGDGWCVLNYEDEELRRFGNESCGAVPVFFSGTGRIPGGVYLEEDAIISELDTEKETVCHIGELKLLGRHNYENVMAAVAICRKMGVPMEKIRRACMSFQAVEHRIEFVREVQGVAYYNDSKGTNPDASIQAVRAMTRPTILIAGGYDKKSSYESWIAEFSGRVKRLILMGETAAQIAAAARQMGFEDFLYAEDMKDAVSIAMAYASRGDAVLLSPACASWDMFSNYEERGRIFKDLVHRL
ncbi:MAG: UDP-N-acetylmuramoyl-L-alanine--D-glutamate ligase [Lachnospiraceae bacterium]|jgi:UDP-N-acetylmuramoylalanine--D-glutamate ligase|nr:UDP-N-acetylmuramoyl-L-alanine--D-glutamate ligase [Lachnospiraceae bacterium]